MTTKINSESDKSIYGVITEKSSTRWSRIFSSSRFIVFKLLISDHFICNDNSITDRKIYGYQVKIKEQIYNNNYNAMSIRI